MLRQSETAGNIWHLYRSRPGNVDTRRPSHLQRCETRQTSEGGYWTFSATQRDTRSVVLERDRSQTDERLVVHQHIFAAVDAIFEHPRIVSAGFDECLASDKRRTSIANKVSTERVVDDVSGDDSTANAESNKVLFVDDIEPGVHKSNAFAACKHDFQLALDPGGAHRSSASMKAIRSD